MLYEDLSKDPHSDDRFHVELHFSPGVVCCLQKNLPIGPGFRTQTARAVHAKVTIFHLNKHKQQYNLWLFPPITYNFNLLSFFIFSVNVICHFQKHFGASKSVDKVLLSSSLPKPSSIKEEEVGDISDISVDDESNSNSDVFLAQSCPKTSNNYCKKIPYFNHASKNNEATLCSPPVS